MNRATALFDVIDVFFHYPQNYKKFPSITQVNNIVYDPNYPDICNADIFYDLALKTPRPVFINIHGGGFVGGDKGHRTSLSGLFASQGYFVINVNYRLSPEFVFPAAIVDMFTLLNFLPTIKEEYNLNLDKIIISGDSAGAYFAAHTVATLKSEILRSKLAMPECSQKICALVSFCGPYDIMLALRAPVPFGLTRVIAECLTGIEIDKNFTNVDAYPLKDYLSPLPYIDSNWCPTFLTYAEKDIFCKGQGEIFAETLAKFNVPYEQYFTTSFFNNHCFHLSQFTTASKECIAKVLIWLDDQLKDEEQNLIDPPAIT